MTHQAVQGSVWTRLSPRRCAMPIPIVCLDVRLRQFVEAFASCFSKPQRQHFVTVLLALLLCREPRALGCVRPTA